MTTHPDDTLSTSVAAASARDLVVMVLIAVLAAVAGAVWSIFSTGAIP